jgi:hypothetical protein
MLIKNWVAERNEGTVYKTQLQNLHKKIYPELNRKITDLSSNWNIEDQNKLKIIFSTIDSLFIEHNKIMNQLKTTSDYDNTANRWDADAKVEENGVVMKITDRVLSDLNGLSAKFDGIIAKENTMLAKSFAGFRILIIWT